MWQLNMPFLGVIVLGSIFNSVHNHGKVTWSLCTLISPQSYADVFTKHIFRKAYPNIIYKDRKTEST